MAYRNFSETAGIDLAIGGYATVQQAASFTDLEWSVVEIARHDPLSSIDPPGRFASRIARLLGSQRVLPLADPKLEALRRFVVAQRHLGDRLPDRELAHFVTAGFSLQHVRLLRSGPAPFQA